jgi:hypothetical protein
LAIPREVIKKINIKYFQWQTFAPGNFGQQKLPSRIGKPFGSMPCHLREALQALQH